MRGDADLTATGYPTLRATLAAWSAVRATPPGATGRCMARRTALASSAVSQPAPRSSIAHLQVPRAEAGSMSSKSGTIPCGPARHTAYVATFPSTRAADSGYAYVGILSPARGIGPLAPFLGPRPP